jgi:Ni/Co efflux regulator RcnB
MNTKLTVLAALLFAGASQAALAQEHDHDREPGQRPPQAHAQPAAPAQHAAPAPAPQGPPGGGDHHWSGGDRQPRFQPQPQAAAPGPQPGPGRWVGEERRGYAGGERNAFQAQPQNGQPAPQPAPRAGDRRYGFAPGAPDGDQHWDRRDAPREVVPPGQNAERGWDRDHDGHAPGRQAWDRRYDERNLDRNGRWAGNGRAPPANWQHWDRRRYPPIYAASHRYHIGAYRPPYGWYVRSWGFGDFLPHGWYASNYWIGDFWDYDLPYPPPGFHWVRVGDDALLVDDYSGRIVQVVNDIFW